ncbi:MAG: endonuclease V [Bacteroidales bacterium]
MESLKNITPKKAKEQQRELAGKVKISGMPDKIEIIAGIDVAYHKKPLTGFCAVSLFKYPEIEHIKTYTELDIIGYPYIPGLLSYREGPLIMDTLAKVEEKIDVLLFDGQGIAHPRGLGIAAHIGVLTNKPSVGCAKKNLFGEYKEPGTSKGAKSNLVNPDRKVIGTVLRTRENTKPVFVSPGHKIGIKEASELVMNCTTKYRLPEPTRIADQKAEKYKNEGDI